MSAPGCNSWRRGTAPVAVIMLSLNEGHNMEGVLKNLQGWAHEVFLVDSYSVDQTVDIALKYGVHVVQRSFRGFGDQWNFALRKLPVAAPWTMKLDPDERLSTRLKESVEQLTKGDWRGGIVVRRRLWFLGTALGVRQRILRVWPSGTCKFSDVSVNEHPLVEGELKEAAGDLEHFDSPSLDHWLNKQNRYTTAEAVNQFEGRALAAAPRLFGTSLQRRMWLKNYMWRIPGRYILLYIYHLVLMGAWRAGRAGRIWSRLRTEVYRLREYKRYEMERVGNVSISSATEPGEPDRRVRQCD